METYEFPLLLDGKPDIKKIREDLNVIFMALQVAYQSENRSLDLERLYLMAKERLVKVTEGLIKNPPTF